MFQVSAGLNPGFGYIKASTDFDTIANQTIAGEPIALLPDTELEENDIIATVDGRTLYLTNLALRKGDPIYFSINEDKANDEITNFVSLATLAQALPYDCEVRVVNALPEKLYFKQKADAESRLLGPHKVIINGEERNFTITGIRTTLQGLDIILDQVLDDEGNMCVPWGKNFLAGIDFGFYTTLLTAINRFKPEERFCKTIDIGVWKAWGLLTKYLETNFNYVLRIEEVDELIKDPIINVNGQDYDIAPAIESAIKSTANAINGQIMRYWPHRQFYKIFAGGGGVYHFGKLVLPGELTPVKDPQKSGVNGCRKYSKREAVWQRKNVG